LRFGTKENAFAPPHHHPFFVERKKERKEGKRTAFLNLFLKTLLLRMINDVERKHQLF